MLNCYNASSKLAKSPEEAINLWGLQTLANLLREKLSAEKNCYILIKEDVAKVFTDFTPSNENKMMKLYARTRLLINYS